MMSIKDKTPPEYRLSCRYLCVEKDETEELSDIGSGDRVRANVSGPAEWGGSQGALAGINRWEIDVAFLTPNRIWEGTEEHGVYTKFRIPDLSLRFIQSISGARI